MPEVKKVRSTYGFITVYPDKHGGYQIGFEYKSTVETTAENDYIN